MGHEHYRMSWKISMNTKYYLSVPVHDTIIKRCAHLRLHAHRIFRFCCLDTHFAFDFQIMANQNILVIMINKETNTELYSVMMTLIASKKRMHLHTLMHTKALVFNEQGWVKMTEVIVHHLQSMSYKYTQFVGMNFIQRIYGKIT